ncbi:MAG TPA: MFS transporter [Acidobacteriota bacterium]|nr:MFS transporter [Acidobacteriota bacterium]HNR39321.1 MFS transporter [Acidobacteriota bacterium]HNU01732.1 MFS transporter [Acidobacteriota bacterium]HPB29713.1 MFS transporter [Acidobacteriota bacterium]HQO24255.1 MFS transporter [Acidobacteriota bacterium]
MRVLTRYRNRWRESSPSLRVFLAGALLLGINNGILTATFNNYLFDSFHVNASVRGLIEFPRELPGFAMIFVTGVLAAFSLRSWAVLVGLTTGVGILGLGYLSPNMSLMIFWMMLWSLGDHLFITAEATIGLKLAEANRAGRRLGQLTGARNLSMILGTAAVWLLMDRLGVRYPGVYALAAATAILAAVAFSRLRLPDDGDGNHRRFVLKKRYTRFYLLNIFWGARKQLFLTFSPWVLVSVFHTPPQTIALLVMAAAVGGVVFRQYFGLAVDRFGERAVLVVDGVAMAAICLGFALSANIYLLYGLFVLDSLMFATRIARITYLNKIAADKQEIAPTLSMGLTLDHVVSMIVPFLAGFLWDASGYPAVFLAALALGLGNLWLTLRLEH